MGAIAAGGIAAPIVLLFGLRQTPASTASILLNFESAATALIAFIAFKEPISRRILAAISVITLAGILLSWAPGQWGVSLGALGIIGACFLWGVDNNFTRKISENDPRFIVAVKGLLAGSFSLLLGLILGNPLPNISNILIAIALGSVSYGLSIQFFILALRELGAARTSAIFGIAPVFGLILSIIILNEKPQTLFWIVLPMMMVGAWIMISENHEHNHIHEAVSHFHEHHHPDIHHAHPHPEGELLSNANHSHFHDHSQIEHTHEHTPDSIHLHKHTD
jgi:drug/metabolite transporter (DMT)-like permease